MQRTFPLLPHEKWEELGKQTKEVKELNEEQYIVLTIE
jgi:hypothetical protein